MWEASACANAAFCAPSLAGFSANQAVGYAFPSPTMQNPIAWKIPRGRRGSSRTSGALSLLSCSPKQAPRAKVSSSSNTGSEKSNRVSRRNIISHLVTASVLAAGVLGTTSPANAANEKVWGAAELDFLMYICGATGKFCPAKTKVTVEPARTLDATFAKTIVDIPSTVLSQRFGIPAGELRSAIEEGSKFYLAEFEKRISFDPNDITNQYTMDFNSYLTYLAIAKIIPDPAKKEAFQKMVGERVLEALKNSGAKIEVADARKGQPELDTIVKGCNAILQTFGETKFVSKYKVDTQEIDAAYFSPDGPPTSFSFTFDSPATLQAMLQMSGEGSRFKPDYVGLALSAYFSQCSIASEYSSYFVDTQYRPNPDDYQPTQVLAQFNLRPMK